MRLLLTSLAALLLCGTTQAAVTLQGSTETFSGPGVYTFDFTITAVGENYTIVGFTIPLANLNGALPLLETPDISLSDLQFTPNPLLELRLASSDFTGSGFGFSISSEDANSSPLVLLDGQSAVLFSIPMNVTTTGPVLGENLPLATLQTITTTTGSAPVIGFAPAVAIPEPSTLGLASIAVAGSLLRRRRR